MSRILDIQKKSNQYMAAFKDNVIRIIEAGQTVAFNRAQMLNSRDANDGQLIHKSTGSPFLTRAYATKEGKSTPNLRRKGSGEFQAGMFLTMPTEKDYIISSDDPKVNFLVGNYGSIFGVSPKNQPAAKAVNDKSIIEDYFKNVFNT